MKKAVFYFLFPLLVLSISGCLPLIIGGAVGALGGYAISKDTIQADSDKPYDQLWNAALDVSRARGNIRQEDAARGYIEADVEKSKVWIRMVRLTQATTRIRISSRKYRLPNLELAQDMFVKMMEGAK